MSQLLDEKRWPHVYLHEVACKCRYRDCPYKTRDQVLAVLDPRILDIYEALREAWGGTPLSIHSGVRCPRHNADEGGVEFSPHVPFPIHPVLPRGKRCYAVDIGTEGHFDSPRDMRREIRARYPDIRIGWAKYRSWCHIDRAFTHPNKNAEMRERWVPGGEW